MVKVIMLRYLSILLLVIIIGSTSCTTDIPIEQRDKLLDIAFRQIESNNDYEIITGLQGIRKYPTYEGLKRTIILWEKDVSVSVESEIITTLNGFEQFKKDSTIISDIFSRNYNIRLPMKKKMKLRRLILNTDVDIRNSLIERIDKEMGPQ